MSWPRLAPKPVSVVFPVAAGWHEELGWWAELRSAPASGPARCYLTADVAAYPTQVADFLTGLARGEDLGSIHPAMHRYRLLADQQQLLDRLAPHGLRRRQIDPE